MDLDKDELKSTLNMQKLTARQMFDKLGYECKETGISIKYKLYDPDDIMTIYISFNKKTKRVIIRCEDDCLDIDELKAIYTQMEELL